MITKVQTNITERNYEYGHATKSMHCNKLLRTLVENMNKRGATFDEIAIFQSDFCNANNIYEAICCVESQYIKSSFDYVQWENSEYLPTPTIVEAAQALYAGLGYVQVGRRPNYYHNPKEDALILRKEWAL